MNALHTEGGDLDLEAAARLLDGSRALTSDLKRNHAIDTVTAAAMLDIAASLRELAAYVNFLVPTLIDATHAAGLAGEAIDDLEPTPQRDLEPGDLVRFAADVDAYEVEGVMQRPPILEVVAVGESEGAAWVTLRNGQGEAGPKVWADQLVLVGTVDRSHLTPAADLEPLPEEPEELTVVAADPDDIDNDFEGDAHRDADAAREQLAKLESKPPKGKSGKGKGRKS